MRILLVGATGQIGNALAHRLASSEHSVTILVRNLHGLLFPENIDIVQRDVFDASVFRQALSRADHVIYAIGIPEQFVFDNRIFRRINVDLLRLFLEQVPEDLGGMTYLSTYEVFSPVDGVVRESHATAAPEQMTPYYRSMVEAYELVQTFAAERDIPLTTIHPAAAYGGRNTGRGFTNYIENLLERRFWQVPFVFKGSFAVVHVSSLADAIARSLGETGAFIVSDQMVTLSEMAHTLRDHAKGYVPLTAPVWVARAGTTVLEALAHLTRHPPAMAHVQIDYITNGVEPRADHAIEVLGWRPLPLTVGIQDYLRARDGT